MPHEFAEAPKPSRYFVRRAFDKHQKRVSEKVSDDDGFPW